MCDLICDVITCCIWSCDAGKINASASVLDHTVHVKLEIHFSNLQNQNLQRPIILQQLTLQRDTEAGCYRYR